MSDEKIVLPGEQISTSEESLPGEGTFEDRGIIKASRMGQVQINKKNKSIIVKPVTSTPVMLKKEDTVVCDVRIVRSSMAIVEAVYVPNKNRGISSDT
ncbi:Exosome complex exonuclease RRP4 N-terminal region, partial [Thermoplasmatales archaeon SCGC AB-539-N05]